ncbi:type IV secretory system conjugative DNA transfer family protein [Streptomyces sp. SYP-A7185]|uniref:type IV secretory system conjugative DNA transfer family protein n=1 Tax=Streptomyces sp. SYP-A7185 TaxID=3040076 RepID=UPI0038F7B91C
MAAEAVDEVEEKEVKETPKPSRPPAKRPLSEEMRWLIGGLAVTGPASGLVYRDAIETWVYDNRMWLLGIAVLLVGSCVLAMTRAYRRTRRPRQRKSAHVVAAFASEGLHAAPAHTSMGACEVPAQGVTSPPGPPGEAAWGTHHTVPGDVAASFQSDDAPHLVAALKLDYAAGKARTLSRGRVDLGEEWVIELPPGGVYGDVAAKLERVISWLDVDATKLTMRPGTTSRQVVITVLDQPIYSRIPALPDPVEAAHRGVIPLGYDMYGAMTEIKSPVGETHMLIAGSSGGGKTEEIKWLVYFALVNGWDIVLVDAKGDGDLAYAEKACLIYEEVPDHERMMEIIAFVEDKHAQRSSENSASVRAGNGKANHRPLLFIVDEVSTYTDEADSKKEATAFETKLKTASRKFRSSKILVVLSTQNPKAEVINTSIRANHRVRIAFGCAETGQSDVILGGGTARAGHDASKLPGIDGAAILQVKDKAREMRGFLVTDEELNAAIDARAEEFHEDEPEHVRLVREAYDGHAFLPTVEFASRLRELGVDIAGGEDRTAVGKAVSAWLAQAFGRPIPAVSVDRVQGRRLSDILPR